MNRTDLFTTMLCREGFSVLAVGVTGLAVLGVAQFIRYAAEDGIEAGWILRHGQSILAVVAAFVLLSWALQEWPGVAVHLQKLFQQPAFSTHPINWALAVALVLGASFLPSLAKALCLVGIGVTLRKVLPIMAESKTIA